MRAKTVNLKEINHCLTMLDSPNPDQRKEAAATLAALSINEENSAAIGELGGIKPLITLLSDKESAVQEKAAAAIWNLSVATQANRIAVRQLGGLQPLITLLNSPNYDIRINSAAALSVLSIDEKNSVAIANLGGLQALIKRLGDRERLVREKAIAALSSLSINDDNSDAIRNLQGIKPLIVLLGDQDSGVQENAAEAIANLSMRQKNRFIIAELKGIKPLINLLDNFQPHIRRNAITALSNLNIDGDNCDEIGKEGGVQHLVERLRDRNTTVRKYAANSLWSLTFDNLANQETLFAFGYDILKKRLEEDPNDTDIKDLLSRCENLSPEQKKAALSQDNIFAGGASSPCPIKGPDMSALRELNTQIIQASWDVEAKQLNWKTLNGERAESTLGAAWNEVTAWDGKEENFVGWCKELVSDYYRRRLPISLNSELAKTLLQSIGTPPVDGRFSWDNNNAPFASHLHYIAGPQDKKWAAQFEYYLQEKNKEAQHPTSEIQLEGSSFPSTRSDFGLTDEQGVFQENGSASLRPLTQETTKQLRGSKHSEALANPLLASAALLLVLGLWKLLGLSCRKRNAENITSAPSASQKRLPGVPFFEESHHNRRGGEQTSSSTTSRGNLNKSSLVLKK